MRIASLIPSATEIAVALGFGDDVAGVTFDPGLAMRLL